MLSSFTIRRTFHETRVTLYVDCDRRDAQVTVSYKRRLIRAPQDVAFWLVDTPDKANRWLSEPVSERGSRLEDLHASCVAGAFD